MKIGLGLLLISLAAVGSVAIAQDAKRSDSDLFKSTVAPFLKQHCIRCHGPEKQEGKVRLDGLSADLGAGPWSGVLARLLAGEMPPAKQPRPPAADVKRVTDWLSAGLKSTARPPDAHHPRMGNRVDHEALFHPRAGIAASSPARVWRLGTFGYTGLVSGLVPVDGEGKSKFAAVIPPFGAGNGTDFREFSSLMQVDEPTINQLLRNAAEIVEFQTTPSTRKGKVQGPPPSRELTALVEGAATPARAEMEGGIRLQFRIVLQRDPAADELREFVAMMEQCVRAAGRRAGVRTALMAVLLLPEALYRMEFGDGKADASGRSRLTAQEIAFALSYALTDQRPDAALRQAVEQGRLNTTEGVRAEVARMLNDAPLRKPRILRFFQEYFGYTLAEDVFKNKNDFKDHAPYVLVRDTDRLIEYVLSRDKDVLVELLTTRKSFVGYDQKPGAKLSFAESLILKGDAHLSYNLDARPDPSQQPVDLPADQRMGILTQPSWLVAFSENTDNNAILRGKWIRERLLGGNIPDLPITVNAMLPDTPEKPLRERMTVTKAAYCWNCHQQMNPLGLPFEMFDHFGRFRKTESVVDPTKPPSKGKEPVPARREVALDSTGTVAGSGDRALDGDVSNALAMIGKLARSERVRQVFVRHAFRYWMGRNETLDDGPTLVAADRAYVDSGGSMKALLTSLLTSDSFLLRRRSP